MTLSVGTSAEVLVDEAQPELVAGPGHAGRSGSPSTWIEAPGSGAW